MRITVHRSYHSALTRSINKRSFTSHRLTLLNSTKQRLTLNSNSISDSNSTSNRIMPELSRRMINSSSTPISNSTMIPPNLSDKYPSRPTQPLSQLWPDYDSMPDEKLVSTNPLTNEIIKIHEEMTPYESEVRDKILNDQLHKTWREVWRKCPIKTRCKIIKRIGNLLRQEDNLDELSTLVHLEMGKTKEEAKGEILKSAGLCDYYGTAGMTLPGPNWNDQPFKDPDNDNDVDIDDIDPVDSDDEIASNDLNLCYGPNGELLGPIDMISDLDRAKSYATQASDNLNYNNGGSGLQSNNHSINSTNQDSSLQNQSLNSNEIQGNLLDRTETCAPPPMINHPSCVSTVGDKNSVKVYNNFSKAGKYQQNYQSLTPLQQALIRFEPQTYLGPKSPFWNHQPAIPGAKKSYYYYESLGTILIIMPWNFPVWQVIRAAIPILISGNCVALKPAPNVFLSGGLKIEDIILKAVREELQGFHPSLTTIFRCLKVSTNKIGKILQEPIIQGVSLTGSERAGRSVAAVAGLLLKRSVVELGGNDAYVLLEKANLEKAADVIVKARFINMGQSCISPKRVIVVGNEERKGEFEKILIEKMKGRVEAGPLAPLVHSQAKKDVMSKVKAAINNGARCIYGDPDGGTFVKSDDKSLADSDSSSAYYNPLILTDLAPDNPSFDTEIFGPVISILPAAKNNVEAVELHNSSSFGLGGAVFGAEIKDEQDDSDLNLGRDTTNTDTNTNSVNELTSLAQELRTGMLAVNDFVRSDASMPFGGIRNSGLGRECGVHGVLEFVNVKSVSIG